MPTNTPLPNRGTLMSALQPLKTTGMSADVQEILFPDVDGAFLVAIARAQDGGMSLVEIDLTTGQVKQLSTMTHPTQNGAQISGDYIMWLDAGHIHLYDRQHACEATIASNALSFPDFNDNIVVWEETHEGVFGVRGYDITWARSFTAAIGTRHSYLFPKACSQNWVIYLEASGPGMADLHAHGTASNKDIVIGQVPLPNDAQAGKQHACDGQRVAWIGSRESGTQQQMHVYDLEGGTNRVLDVPAQGLPSVMLDDDILLASVGYDLRQDVSFDLRFDLPPEVIGSGGYLRLSGDVLVYVAGGMFGTQQSIYTARIERQP